MLEQFINQHFHCIVHHHHMNNMVKNNLVIQMSNLLNKKSQDNMIIPDFCYLGYTLCPLHWEHEGYQQHQNHCHPTSPTPVIFVRYHPLHFQTLVAKM